jgi:hypothetical protein
MRIGLGPNIDFFSFQEIEALAKRFKESLSEQQQNNVDFDLGRGEPGSITMSNYFENNMNRSASGSLAKKLTRRPTKKIEESVLNRHKNVVTIVQK